MKHQESGIRTKLAQAYARMHHRYGAEVAPVNFYQAMHFSGPMLIILPRESTAFDAARHVLSYLRYFVGGDNARIPLHAFLHETYKNWLDSRLIPYAMAWSDQDLNMVRLPGNKLLNRVAALKCTVALDLNLEEDLSAAYVIGMTGAQVRMSIGAPRLQQFYNLQLQVPVSKDLRETYHNVSRQLYRTFYHECGEFPETLDEY